MNGHELFEKLASSETNTKHIQELKSQIKTTITVVGRRWFERVNGNTYHSVEVYVNGALLERVPFQYGYGSQYEQTAMDILEKHKIVDYPGLVPYPSMLPKEKFIVVTSVSDVNRKRDL